MADFKGEVMEKQCDQCLFLKGRIVEDDRKAEIIRDCLRRDTHFICHKATIAHRNVACAGFVKKYPGVGQLLRIFDRVGGLRRVKLPVLS